MDKFYHFVICFVLSLWSTELAVGCGITKEWCDKIYADNWDWSDLWCDVVGVVFGSLVRILIIGRYNWF